MNKLLELFCDVDDFCSVFIPLWQQQLITDGERKRQRAGRMNASEIMTIIIALLETGNHVIPFMKNVLDTKDPQFFIQKILVLFTSIILYILVFLLTYKRSADEFDKIDI